jgi:hypothetical protein
MMKANAKSVIVQLSRVCGAILNLREFSTPKDNL